MLFFVVCIAICVTCHFISKALKEKQRQLEEASKLLPAMVNQAVVALPTAAPPTDEDRLRIQQENNQLEAYGAKFDALAESREIRSLEDMSQERITCANGHHFLFIDFDRHGACCPMCKTSAFSFDEPDARRYWFCSCGAIGLAWIVRRVVEEQGGTFILDDTKQLMHWFRGETDDCPLCRWAEDQGIKVTRNPLSSISLNVEKLKAQQGAGV